MHSFLILLPTVLYCVVDLREDGFCSHICQKSLTMMGQLHFDHPVLKIQEIAETTFLLCYYF